MHLLIERNPSNMGATIGTLYVDGALHCWTCEDVIREQPGRPVAEWKVPGKTAIPAGTYAVTVTHSNRFKKPLPLLMNVPGFAGIRIHTGNTAADTEGCILPGAIKRADRVLHSTPAFDGLFALIRAALARGEPVTIEIRNPSK